MVILTEEHERLGKNAYVSNVSICARPFEGDEPEFCGCKIRWEGGTGRLVGGGPQGGASIFQAS